MAKTLSFHVIDTLCRPVRITLQLHYFGIDVGLNKEFAYFANTALLRTDIIADALVTIESAQNSSISYFADRAFENDYLDVVFFALL